MKPYPAGTWEQRRPWHCFATTAPSPRDENGWRGGNGGTMTPPPAPKISLRALILPGKIQTAAASHLPRLLNNTVPSCYIMGCLKHGDDSREKESSTYTPRSEQVERDQFSFSCCNDKAPVNTSSRRGVNSWHRAALSKDILVNTLPGHLC